MIRKFIILYLQFLFCSSLAWSADSVGNRKDQKARLGLKSGVHLFYLVTSPFVLEFPGEDWTFGLVYGSGKLQMPQTQTSSDSSSGYESKSLTETWIFNTAEVTGRYYIGNSFNVPFGVAMYNIKKTIGSIQMERLGASIIK